MHSFPDRVEAAFNRAADLLSPDAREAFLREHCADDPALLARVRELLLAYDGGGGFLEQAPVGGKTAGPEEAVPTVKFASRKPEDEGDHIANYKLLQQIGEGGFGVVWMAEQEKPVRRRVALKVIKAGMDTREVVARFEQERQALAMMDHPNIAKVFDAGATEYGRPFFVMELVRGVKITDYCDQANLPTAERLELFMAVCQAVQHAHQKGIIHRDLKPSNILVALHDGVPVPKVIDFGVAKATQQQRLTDLTLFTHFEQMVGTPLYMSPEQAEMSGLDIDTRSDIYSLGVLLYELLAGRTPFDPEQLMKAGYDEMRRVIREQEPQKPSTLLSTMAADVRTTVAQHRRMEGAKLISTIRGDLDWIVMKALEKDRSRRYETANGLAKDIQRHLADEPVQARPATPLYRFRRMVRRNKGVFGAATAVAAALVMGLTASVWQTFLADRETGLAEIEAARAVAAVKRTSVVLHDLQATAPAFAEQARALVAGEQFDAAIEKLDYAIKLRPDVAAYLLSKADLLQCQLRLAEAAAAYRAVLAVAPDDVRAKSNMALCGKLLSANPDPQKLSRESLSELFSSMQKEQRSGAELGRIGALVEQEKSSLLAYWLERLQGLPIPPAFPLAQRLTMREDGLLSLDLSATKVADLRPLEGMPLGYLFCQECAGIEDLTPLRGMPLKTLNAGDTRIADLSPLATLPALARLSLVRTKITDLKALSGLLLKELYIDLTAVSDISALRGMPLETLTIQRLPVDDLSALPGMPLKMLHATGSPAKDFTPLADLPLEQLFLQEALNVGDLEFLRRMPLRQLILWGCPQSSNYAVLSSIPTLELLTLPRESINLAEAELAAISALKMHPGLGQIGTAQTGGANWMSVVSPKEQFWQEWDRWALFLTPLRKQGAKVTLETLPDWTWDVSLRNQPISDISCLIGAPISRLLLQDTGVTDLTPLKGMPLKWLGIQNIRVTNLRALAGLPLTDINLHMCDPNLDVSVLAQVPSLEQIVLPPNPKGLESLRKLPNLKYLSYEPDYGAGRPTMSSAQFWAGMGKQAPLSSQKLAREGKFDQAAQLLRARLRDGGSFDERLDWLKLATLELTGGDYKAYRATCKLMVKRYKNTTISQESEVTAKVCLLAPASGIGAAEIAGLIERSRSLTEDATLRTWFFLVCGLQDYRAGRWPEAARQLHQVGTFPATKAPASALLAMIYHRQKNRDAAIRELAAARQQILPHWAETPDWFVASVLLQEAEVLIEGRKSEVALAWEGRFAELELLLRKRSGSGTSTDDSGDRLALGLLALTRGNHAVYREVCKTMLKRFAKATNPHDAEIVIKLCLASPGSGIGVAELSPLMEMAHASANDPDFRSSHLFPSGLAEYRAGHWDKAAGLLHPAITAPTAAVLAMTRHQQGQTTAATEELANTRGRIKTWEVSMGWADRMLAQLLLQEAEALIAGDASADGNK